MRFLPASPVFGNYPDDYYIYNGYQIVHLKHEQVIEKSSAYEPLSNSAIQEEINSFWTALYNSPKFIQKEDQWTSYLYSFMNGMFIDWYQDRKDQADNICRIYTQQEFESINKNDPNALKWAKDISVK